MKFYACVRVVVYGFVLLSMVVFQVLALQSRPVDGVVGSCIAVSDNCLWSSCCESVGDSCVIQPQGFHCERDGWFLSCFDMGNSACVRVVVYG